MASDAPTSKHSTLGHSTGARMRTPSTRRVPKHGPAPSTVTSPLGRRCARPDSSSELTLARGDTVGRYVVVDKIASGGIGVVYRAYDPELDRRVALKLVRSDYDTRTRLVREAQALAKLSHPNVISVYDVGNLRDQVFIAMEYVQGDTLREWLRAERRGLRAIVEVFVAAGRGVRAAHAVGLIHRDFKPDNVLVADDGRVHVVDFGLARAADYTSLSPTLDVLPDMEIDTDGFPLATPLTQTGALLGTPGYMAPEQHLCAGSDERTDQFAFCVALFEALYGQRPFRGKTLGKLAHCVTHGNITEPADARIPRRYRRIIHRGLSVAPEDRFPSMDALLAALRRAMAAPRRIATAAIAALAVAVVAVGGVALATRDAPAAAPQVCHSGRDHLAGAWDDDVRASMRAAFDGRLRPYAPDSFRRVEVILDDYADRWTEMRTDACERTHVHGDQSPHLLDLRVQCLDQRARVLQETTTLLSVGVDAALIDHAVETALQLPALDACSDVEALLAAYPPPEDEETRGRIDAISQRIAHAQALANAGRYADALAIAEQIAHESIGVPYPPLQARAHYLQGHLQHELGRKELARESLYAAARYAAAARDDELVAQALVLAQINEFYSDRADGKSGADALDMSDVIEVALERAGDANTARAAHLMSTGEMLLKLDRWNDSRAIFERAIALQTELYGDTDVRVAEALRQLASTLPDTDGDRRLALLQRALAIKQHVLGGNHPEVAEMLNTVGVWTPDEQVDDVVAAFDQSMAIFENAFGGDDWTVGRALNNGGEAMCNVGHIEPGLERLQRGVRVYEHAFGADHCHLAYPLTGIADCHNRAGHPARAIAPLERALANCAGSDLHADLLAHTRFSLAKALVESGDDTDRALTLAEDARKAFAEMGAHRADRLDEVKTWLAKIRASTGTP